jgi:hypothetical protein
MPHVITFMTRSSRNEDLFAYVMNFTENEGSSAIITFDLSYTQNPARAGLSPKFLQ